MMKLRIRKRCLSVLLAVSLLVGMTGTAFAWDFSQMPNGWSYANFTLSGGMDAGGAFAISVDGRNWKHLLYVSEIMGENDPMGNPSPVYTGADPSMPYYCSLPTVSFDPNDYLQMFGGNLPCVPIGGNSYMPNVPVTVCDRQENDPNIYVHTMYNTGIRYSVIYLKRDVWQTYADRNLTSENFWQTLHMNLDYMGTGLHVMADLRYLQEAFTANGSSVSLSPYLIYGEPYEPLRVTDETTDGVWQDTDGDNVCSAAEIQSNLTLGAPVYYIASGASPESFQADVSLLPAGCVIPVPILMWNEGQVQAAGSANGLYASWTIGVDSSQYMPIPFDYGTFTQPQPQTGYMYSGITGINPWMMQYEWIYDPDDPMNTRNQTLLQLMQNSGFMLEASTRTLFLPYWIEGMPVHALGSNLFRQSRYDSYLSTIFSTIVVPNSVQYLADDLFCMNTAPIPRLHLPTGVQFEHPFWGSDVSTVCTSTYDPAMEAYCQSQGIIYEVCAGHIPLHTHTFDNGVVTPPTYRADGYTTYTCTDPTCGGSYDAPGSARLPAPTLTLQGGTAAPGGTADVTVSLTDNAGLDGITLQPQYDPQTLTLEAVSAAQGLTAALAPDGSVTVTSTATYTGTDLCTLTFRAAADAAAGQQAVQVTSSLTVPADHGEWEPLALAAAQTDVTILSAPTPALTVQSGSGTPGTLVPVTVRLANNPGLVSLLMEISYDATALELDHVEDCGLFGTGSADNPGFVAGHDLTDDPYTICWSDDNAQQANTQNGDLAVFWFRVRTQAQPGAYDVSVRTVDSSTLDLALDPVAVTAAAAQIGVSALSGDANGDGTVTAADALAIRQSLHDPAADPIATANADMDGDGVITENDALVIQRSIVDN